MLLPFCFLPYIVPSAVLVSETLLYLSKPQVKKRHKYTSWLNRNSVQQLHFFEDVQCFILFLSASH